MLRAAAAVVAIACWAGLAIQFSATFAQQHDILSTLWVLFRFFTVITNLLVALAMTWAARGGRVSPAVLGGLTLAILLVGVVYMTLLQGLVLLSGQALLADALLHKVAPVLMPLYLLLALPFGAVANRLVKLPAPGRTATLGWLIALAAGEMLAWLLPFEEYDAGARIIFVGPLLALLVLPVGFALMASLGKRYFD